jgi:hypothetical protein
MAPNTSSSAGDVCVEDARSALTLDSFDAASLLSTSTANSKRADVVIFFDWGKSGGHSAMD